MREMRCARNEKCKEISNTRNLIYRDLLQCKKSVRNARKARNASKARNARNAIISSHAYLIWIWNSIIWSLEQTPLYNNIMIILAII